MLGLVVKRKDRYALSSSGRRYVNLTPGRRKEIILRQMLSCPVILSVLVELIVSPSHSVSRDGIISIVSHRSGISGTTVSRRVRSVLSWITWIGEETGLLGISKGGASFVT